VLKGTYSGRGNEALTIEFAQDIVIEAENPGEVIFDLGGQSWFLTFSKNKQVTVKGITFKNARTQQDGSVFFVTDAILTIDGCTFTNNTANRGGAIAIFGKSSTLSINSTKFENNNASTGGAIYSEQTSYVTTTQVTFSGNRAKVGGCGYLRESHLSANNLLAEKNHATSGGCFYLYLGAYTASFNDTIARENDAAVDGGFIYSYLYILQSFNSTYEKNIAFGNGGAVNAVSGGLLGNNL
jgi:predicted outer membrane repeat protein